MYNVDIAIGDGGVHEVKRHCETMKHKQLLEGVNAQSIISVIATASKDAMSDKVMKSELYFARFVAEHNMKSIFILARKERKERKKERKKLPSTTHPSIQIHI